MRSLCIGLTLGALGAASAASATTWTETALHAFCASSGCSDGGGPGLPVLKSGNVLYSVTSGGGSLLYGATLAGGGPTSSSQGDGTIYALESGTIWSQKVIHEFCSACSATCTTCSDGVSVFGQMVMDANNTLWGTTLTGGSGANGVAWQLTPGTDPWGDPWSETLLYNFCWGGASKCLDGSAPTGAMLDGSGNIFGTTQQGGNGVAAAGNGILFELAAGSSCTEGGVATFLCETVEHNFCHTTCSDGSVPNGDLVMSTTGKIFGTASQGGANGGGVAFRQNGATNVTIYTFCRVGSCTDGDAARSRIDPGFVGRSLRHDGAGRQQQQRRRAVRTPVMHPSPSRAPARGRVSFTQSIQIARCNARARRVPRLSLSLPCPCANAYSY
jgi:hypothetical protein